mmetsp:Transcript_6964/g.12781  ORF Transcript_6964/g.12781 Transcript_6964/m.12781 type:complete len:202 (+) Transcript_6964:659-1264(+)
MDQPFAKVCVWVKGAWARSRRFSMRRPCSTSTSMTSSAWIVNLESSWNGSGGTVKPGMSSGASFSLSHTQTSPSFSLIWIPPCLCFCFWHWDVEARAEASSMRHSATPVSPFLNTAKGKFRMSKVVGSSVTFFENSTGCQKSTSSLGQLRSERRSACAFFSSSTAGATDASAAASKRLASRLLDLSSTSSRFSSASATLCS